MGGRIQPFAKPEPTATLTLIVLTTLARLALAATLGPGNDEAYYRLYGVHPALGYFDQPPMLAWVQSLGVVFLGDRAPLGPRLGFVLLAAGSSWLLYRLTARRHGPTAGFWAVVGLNATPYYGIAAGTFALPDGPLLFFWLLTVDRLATALEGGSPVGRWAAVGLAWGGALLSKYHAVLLPAGALLAMIAHRPWRIGLRRPGPYLALAIGLVMFTPVLIWNARNGWISFRFQGGRALGSWTPDPRLMLSAVGGPLLYLSPWIGVALILAFLRGWRRRAEGFEALGLAIAAVPLILVGTVGMFRPVLPHWSLIATATLFPGLGRDWAGALADRPRRARIRAALALGVPLVLGVLLVGHARSGWLQRLIPPSADPTAEIVGWDEIAGRLRPHLREGDFVFSRVWYQAGHLARVLGDDVPVFCYSDGDARGFALWTDPAACVGRDGLLVSIGPSLEVEPACFERWFARLEPRDDFTIDRAGVPLVRVTITRCVAQKAPFPVGNGKLPLDRRGPDRPR